MSKRGQRILCRTLTPLAWALFATIANPLHALAQGGDIPCRYEVSHIIQAPECGIFGFLPTVGTGISPNGEYVCGYTWLCSLNGFNKGWMYKTATSELIFLPMPTGISTVECSDVNDAGLVAGHMGGSAGDFGFIYNLHTGQFIAQLPSLDKDGSCTITAINAAGTVCGTRSIDIFAGLTTAFRWSEETGIEDLGLIENRPTTGVDINDNNTVVGRMTVINVLHPFLWDGSQITDVGTLVGFHTQPRGLNNTNQVVGLASLVPNGLVNTAFLWSNSFMSNLEALPGHNRSNATGIAENGLVLGDSRNSAMPDNTRAVIWRNGEIRDLNLLLETGSGVFLTSAGRASGDGLLLTHGSFVPPSVNTPFVCILEPVYAPASELTGDCHIGVPDLLAVINAWGPCAKTLPCDGDVNGDDVVNLVDLMQVIRDWGTY